MRYVAAGLLALSLVALILLSSTGVVAQREECWYRYGPYVDKITFPVMKDCTMRLLAFEAGELSTVGVLPAHLDRITG